MFVVECVVLLDHQFWFAREVKRAVALFDMERVILYWRIDLKKERRWKDLEEICRKRN